MSIFVIGTVGRLQVGDRVVKREESVGRELGTDKPVKIPASLAVAGSKTSALFTAQIARGVAKESKGFIARVLPPDAEPGLAELGARIVAKQAELDALYRERQEYLVAHAARGERIGVKHATGGAS